ncbi:GNAT family N-acetyltransferase [Sporomusa termitida]|nr:GNAT family N-acetyltransferase [Sporomusa termitida]
MIESERLIFRKIVRDDFAELCAILQDREVMYAWEHAFSDAEVREWIEENLDRYDNEGFSYFAAITKNTQELVGVIGPLQEMVEGVPYIGVAYILNRRFWGKGYALEGAKAAVQYAFAALQTEKVIAQIRPANLRSRQVAEKLGMEVAGEFTKQYHRKAMCHLLYVIERRKWRKMT